MWLTSNDCLQQLSKISHCYASCERPILNCELQDALKHLKAGKSPGNDGLPAELPLMNVYKECIVKKEMSTTMKQGLITVTQTIQRSLSIELETNHSLNYLL